MKAQTFILTVLFFLLTISFLPGNSTAALSNAGQTNYELTKSSFKGDYTYERVFKDGIWWIYVYDGGVLIAVFPE